MYRQTEILDPQTDDWLPVSFDDLRCGDIFQLFEPNGKVVKDKQGNSIFIALSNAKDGSITIEPMEKT